MACLLGVTIEVCCTKDLCNNGGEIGTVMSAYNIGAHYCTNFSSVRGTLMMRPQQDISKSFCSCCYPPLLSCSFLAPLGLPPHYPSTSLVAFSCFLFPPLVRIALLPVVPPTLLHVRTPKYPRTASAFFSRFCLSM